MFNKPTTFVIGAGCSREYGLPLGDALRVEIARMLAFAEKTDADDYSRIYFISPNKGPDALFTQAAERLAQLNNWPNWRQTAGIMSRGLAHASSIDRYLDLHANDPVIVALGKLAIARAIMRAERDSSVFFKSEGRLDRDTILQGAGSDPDWLHQLLLRLQDGVRIDNALDIFKNICFVCFNYDRVIEHYLYHAIQSLLNAPPIVAAQIMSRLTIYHPYGQVGKLPWQATSELAPVEFGAELRNPDEILKVADGIKTFTESVDDVNIRQAVQYSNKLVFAGFSFLRQNLELLRPPTMAKVSKIYATNFGMSSYDTNAADSDIQDILQGTTSDGFVSYKVHFDPMKAGQFMAAAGNSLRS